MTEGSEFVNQSGVTLDEIMTAVKRVTDIIAEISAASQEQAGGIEQVNNAIRSMDDTTQQNAALVEETTSAIHSMKEQAKELMQQVEAFKICGSVDFPGVKREAHPNPGSSKSAGHTTLRGASRSLSMPVSGNAKGERRESPSLSDKTVGVAVRSGLNSKRIIDDEFEEF